MAVLKNKTQGNYTVVSMNIMKDKNLSLTERGMLLTLLSLPDNWHLTIMGLCQILPDGKDRISKTLNSLIDKGYVTREQGRNNGGKFDSTNLEVHESPIKVPDDPKPTKREKREESMMEYTFSPCPENTDTVNPHAEKPCSENPPQYNKYISNNHKNNIYEVCKADTLTDSQYDDLVSEYGKEIVDYQIQRINDRGYKGCLNYETIKTWCEERKNRPVSTLPSSSKKNSFSDFKQREYDFDELERLLLAN